MRERGREIEVYSRSARRREGDTEREKGDKGRVEKAREQQREREIERERE